MTPDRSRVLIVEDDRLIREFLVENLTADGHVALPAPTLAAAEQVLDRAGPDIVLLDLGLPDGDGLSLLSALRDPEGPVDVRVGVIVLSGRAGEIDRIRGLDRGADDYLGKPFSYPELRSRIAAVLRRAPGPIRGGRVTVGALVLDPLSRGAWLGGEPVHLSKKEFALLQLLASDPTRTFTRDEILAEVWGFRNPDVMTRTLDTHAHRLRRKLRAGEVPMVRNVWGVGYRLLDGWLPGA
jgi:DNA-binding response OmpR family regulator